MQNIWLTWSLENKVKHTLFYLTNLLFFFVKKISLVCLTSCLRLWEFALIGCSVKHTLFCLTFYFCYKDNTWSAGLTIFFRLMYNIESFNWLLNTGQKNQISLTYRNFFLFFTVTQTVTFLCNYYRVIYLPTQLMWVNITNHFLK